MWSWLEKLFGFPAYVKTNGVLREQLSLLREQLAFRDAQLKAKDELLQATSQARDEELQAQARECEAEKQDLRAILQAKDEQLQSQASDRQAQVLVLRGEIDQQRKLIENLKKTVAQLSPPAGIDGTGGEILKSLERDENQFADMLAEGTGKPIEEVKLHLGRLLEAKMIRAAGFRPRVGSSYAITQKGREWLDAHR